MLTDAKFKKMLKEVSEEIEDEGLNLNDCSYDIAESLLDEDVEKYLNRKGIKGRDRQIDYIACRL